MAERKEHPVISGLLALVGVALVVGLVLGLTALAGSKVLGLDDSSGTGGGGSAQQSAYIPQPRKTKPPSGPLITLEGQPTSAASDASASPGQPKKTKKPRKKITLGASTTDASTMGLFDLTGVYPDGEGSILQVQRFEDGHWADFNATTSVADQTFSLPVQSGKVGVNRFRVVDTDSGLKSNEVRVTVG